MLACPGKSLIGLLLANQAQVQAGDLGLLANVLAILSQVVRSAGFAGPHLLWEALVANVMPDDRWWLWRWGWWSHWWFHWRLWNRRWLWRLWLSLLSGSVTGIVPVKRLDATDLDDPHDRQEHPLQHIWERWPEIHGKQELEHSRAWMCAGG